MIGFCFCLHLLNKLSGRFLLDTCKTDLLHIADTVAKMPNPAPLMMRVYLSPMVAPPSATPTAVSVSAMAISVTPDSR